MNLFEFIVLNIILMSFPILIWIIYISYNQNVGKKENNLLLDFTLISSIYLAVRFGNLDPNVSSMLILNIPLLIAYLKNRIPSIIIVSIFLITYYVMSFDIPMYVFIIEYLVFFVIYLLLDKFKIKYLRYLVSIKILIYIAVVLVTEYYGEFTYIVLLQIIYTVVLIGLISYFVINWIKKSDEIMKYHMTIKELEQDKQIRSSLFKISHEIKNPIAVCKGYLEMFDINNENHSKKYIPILKEEVNRVLILLQDFLSITKIKIEEDIVDINMVVEDTLDNFIPILSEKNISLKSNIPVESIYILGDYNRLQQAFINIIKNSIEALSERVDGVIIVDVIIDKNNVVVTFKDNGEGMSKEMLENIFEPFITGKKYGTGLGVSLLKEIITAHRGKVKYESKLGEGTTAIITLPIKK